MPLNSNTVVMQENTEIIDNKLLIKVPAYGDNCRNKASLFLKEVLY